jgi:hypothetical protein
MVSMMWDSFRDHIELAMATHPGEVAEDLQDLRKDIVAGRAKLLQVWDGVEVIATAVLELQRLRDGDTLHVRYLAGECMDLWLDDLHMKLEQLARQNGCKWISLTGRMGWKRELKRLDYNPVAIQLRAEVA